MKKKITMISFGILLALLMLSLASAVVSHYQEILKYSQDDHITRRVLSVFWVEGDLLSGSFGNGAVRDEINSDELLEVEIDYSIYVQKWNTQNYDYAIENCTLTINYFENKGNGSYVFYERTINKTDSDVLDDKYFVRLNQKDGISVFMDCYFQDADKRSLITPTELSIKLPTYECKTCQYYEWSVQQRSIREAEIVGGNSVLIWSYIQEFLTFNFEIILALFWFMVIIITLMASGFIFLGIYFLFIFLRKIARDI